MKNASFFFIKMPKSMCPIEGFMEGATVAVPFFVGFITWKDIYFKFVVSAQISHRFTVILWNFNSMNWYLKLCNFCSLNPSNVQMKMREARWIYRLKTLKLLNQNTYRGCKILQIWYRKGGGGKALWQEKVTECHELTKKKKKWWRKFYF